MATQHQIPELGRLVRVPIREVWTSEPYAFDPWLSQPNNLQFLSEALELPGLELLHAQSPVGPFYADLVCQVVGTDHKVIIENQLDKADHRHLGQVLTYAPHHDAKICVWVAAEICDEHRAAVDWLNRITGEGYAFFGVEVRAVKIGDSKPAPLFDVVAKPNDWTKPQPSSAASAEVFAEQVTDNIDFWSALDELLEAQGRVQRRVKKSVKGQNLWIPLTSDGAVYIVVFRAFSNPAQIGAYIGVYGDKRKAYWDQLSLSRPRLEEAFQEELRWEENRTGSVYKVVPASLPTPPTGPNRDVQIDWLVARINRLFDVFHPVLEAAQSREG